MDMKKFDEALDACQQILDALKQQQAAKKLAKGLSSRDSRGDIAKVEPILGTDFTALQAQIKSLDALSKSAAGPDTRATANSQLDQLIHKQGALQAAQAVKMIRESGPSFFLRFS